MMKVKKGQVVECEEGRHWQVVWTYDHEDPQRFIAIDVANGTSMNAYTTTPGGEPRFTLSTKHTIHQRMMALTDAVVESVARSNQAILDTHSTLSHPDVAEAVRLMRDNIVGGRWRSVPGMVVYLLNRAGIRDMPQCDVVGLVEQRRAQLIEQGWTPEFQEQAAKVLGYDLETQRYVALNAIAEMWLYLESLFGESS